MSFESEALERDRQWLQRLARSMVDDPDVAEDISQDAWVAALTHDRAAHTPIRHWLVTVVRNLVRDRARARARRPERLPGADLEQLADVHEFALERLEIHEQLISAVKRLAEPYRTVVVLRYLEELSLDDIARRTQSPVRTVQTRLNRALEQLREKLDRDRSREEWLGALLPMIDRSTFEWLALVALKTGLRKNLAVASLVALVAVLSWFVFRGSNGASTTAVESAPNALASPSRASDELRAAVTSEPDATIETPNRSVAKRRGLVIDVHDRPVAGAHITIALEVTGEVLSTAASTSDAAGLFEFDEPNRAVTLRASGEHFATLLAPIVDPREDLGPTTIVVGPLRSVTGAVVDRSRNPIADVLVRPQCDSLALRAKLERILDATVAVEPLVRTDRQGRFAISFADVSAQTTLEFTHGDFETRTVRLSDLGDSVVVLDRSPRVLTSLGGRIFDSTGAPVEGAHVFWVAHGERGPRIDAGVNSAQSDAEGWFVLPAVEPSTWATLRFVKPGFELLEFTFEAESSDPLGTLPATWVMHPRTNPLVLRGRVVDESGAPRVGWRVRLADATYAGRLTGANDTTASAEPLSVEALLGHHVGRPEVVTASDGGFELTGLLEREYRLEVFSNATLQRHTTTPLRAGQLDVNVTVREEPSFERIAGRAVNGARQPAPGVVVVLARAMETLRFDDAPADKQLLSGAPVTTDAEGRFEFFHVPRGVWSVSAKVPGTARLAMEVLPKIVDPCAIELQLHEIGHVQVVFAPGRGEGCRVWFEEPSGAAPWSQLRQGRELSVWFELEFFDGRSPAVSIPTSVTTLCVERAGAVEKIELRVIAGEMTVVRL